MDTNLLIIIRTALHTFSNIYLAPGISGAILELYSWSHWRSTILVLFSPQEAAAP